MNRPILYIFGFIALCVIAGGALYWYLQVPSEAGPATQPQSETQYPSQPSSGQSTVPATASSDPKVQAVQATFNRANTGNIDNIAPGKTVIEGEYALVSWQGNSSGGTALMQYSNQEWTQVSITGGIWNVAELHDLGVPQTITLALLRDIRASGN